MHLNSFNHKFWIICFSNCIFNYVLGLGDGRFFICESHQKDRYMRVFLSFVHLLDLYFKQPQQTFATIAPPSKIWGSWQMSVLKRAHWGENYTQASCRFHVHILSLREGFQIEETALDRCSEYLGIHIAQGHPSTPPLRLRTRPTSNKTAH